MVFRHLTVVSTSIDYKHHSVLIKPNNKIELKINNWRNKNNLDIQDDLGVPVLSAAVFLQSINLVASFKKRSCDIAFKKTPHNAGFACLH